MVENGLALQSFNYIYIRNFVKELYDYMLPHDYRPYHYLNSTARLQLQSRGLLRSMTYSWIRAQLLILIVVCTCRGISSINKDIYRQY